LNASDDAVRPLIDHPVDPKIVEELSRKFPEFGSAYSEDGIAVDGFDSFAPTRRTLRQCIAVCHDLDGLVRDIMLPNPDVA
jgi:transaldolase